MDTLMLHKHRLLPVAGSTAAGNTAAAVLTFKDMRNRLADWNELAAHSIEDNVYYSPKYALALLDTVEAKSDVHFATVWRNDRLIGLLPVQISNLAVPGLQAAGKAWQSDYTYSTTPLLDRDHAVAAAQGLIEVLGMLRRGEWVLSVLNRDGPACAALGAALARLEIPSTWLGGFDRASLSQGDTFDAHMKLHLTSDLRRKLARRRRRLEEKGRVSVESCKSGASLAEALETFLRLEAKGWKGKRGTALDCNDDSRAFARRAFTSNTPGECRIDLLKLDDRSVAAAVTVFAGQTGFSVKTAYDEEFASFGASHLLDVELLKSYLTEGWSGRLDSATNGPHVIDDLWPGRVRVSDLAFSTAGRGGAQRLTLFAAGDRFKRDAKRRVKSWLGRK